MRFIINKRCEHCGGRLIREDDGIKCLQCSRPYITCPYLEIAGIEYHGWRLVTDDWWIKEICFKICDKEDCVFDREVDNGG